MATTRIKDLTAASGIADDDYIVVDGATNGTRKALASDVGGSEKMYKIASSFTTTSIDARGVWNTLLILTLKNASDATAENLMKMKAFACTSRDPDDTMGSSSENIYPMEITHITRGATTSVSIDCKVHYGNPQATSTNYLSASYFTVIAPFEMTAITRGM